MGPIKLVSMTFLAHSNSGT